MKIFKIVLCYGLALLLIGCASAQKAELTSGDNPAAAVTEVTNLMNRAEQEQADLLAYREFTKGSEYLAKASRELAAKRKDERILDNAAIAKTYFQQADSLARSRSVNAARILLARKATVAAGLKSSPALAAEMADVDDDLRDETDDFAEALGPKEFSEYQRKYFALEVKAVQFRELDGARQAIAQANKRDADELAPSSLKMAMLDLSEAENLVAQSPRNPNIHMNSVKKSLASAKLLADVMDVISNAKGTPENIALKIVSQNRQLGTLEANLQSTQSNLSQTEGALKEQQEALMKSSTQVRFQEAMEKAGQQFSEDEASVYQQGNKLIFRLKKINFASGTSNVPDGSKPLLVKINDIIRSLDAEIVAVQGHTDSVGSSDLNKKLSEKRATSVANYLASLGGGYKIGYIGYGEARPIASNETKEGRAVNRRVDLVVTAKK